MYNQRERAGFRPPAPSANHNVVRHCDLRCPQLFVANSAHFSQLQLLTRSLVDGQLSSFPCPIIQLLTYYTLATFVHLLRFRYRTKTSAYIFTQQFIGRDQAPRTDRELRCSFWGIFENDILSLSSLKFCVFLCMYNCTKCTYKLILTSSNGDKFICGFIEGSKYRSLQKSTLNIYTPRN